jgi:hypothetical protein
MQRYGRTWTTDAITTYFLIYEAILVTQQRSSLPFLREVAVMTPNRQPF